MLRQLAHRHVMDSSMVTPGETVAINEKIQVIGKELSIYLTW
jgi:hypothetical protein